LANAFRRLCPSVKIKLSGHYNIDDIGKLDFALRKIGVDVVVISQFANKNFRFLRQAVEKYGPDRLEILCSVTCIAGCPYRQWHLQAMAHVGDMDINLRTAAIGAILPCCADKLKKPHMLMSSMFIRREDILYYRKLGISRFKIGERMAGTACNNAFAKYYTGKVRKPPRQMIEIMFRGCVDEANLEAMDGYYEKFFQEECEGTRYDCTECDHCSKYARSVFRINSKLRRKIPADHHKGYYTNYADYIENLISTVDKTW
jgi:collagenase-like PrtC family protease